MSSSLSLHQVSFLEEDVGRMNTKSKIRVTWVFRMEDASKQPEEHSVTLTWSKKTGKLEIGMDESDQIWFGKRQGASIFDYSWTAQNLTPPLRFHVLGTCAPNFRKNFRSFDLIINGQIFAHLPQYGGGGAVLEDDSIPADADTSPRSIYEIIYPNGYTATAEVRQPEQQEQYAAYQAPPPEPDAVPQTRVDAEPIDLLS
mmetsp:Transcript_5354/g.10070  ORF Transcript_5354/g.10070 Transcript_5354/m.10070 type:complete len:200 (+) Transcript_5354:21-620(+)